MQDDRKHRRVSAWEYGARLARLKGVQVVHADTDAYHQRKLSARRTGKDVTGFSNSLDEEYDLKMDADDIRERAAVNILKDFALENFLPERLVTDKRRLVLFFGAGHKESLEKKFNNLGIKARVEYLEMKENLTRMFSSLVMLASAEIDSEKFTTDKK